MDQSLSLFLELANGYNINLINLRYSSVRNLRKSETAQFLLANHSADFFPFLEISHQSKNRSRYYTALAKILFAGEPDTFEPGFHQFSKSIAVDDLVKPFSVALTELAQIQDPNLMRQDRVKVSLS